jgi:hypothetical protein
MRFLSVIFLFLFFLNSLSSEEVVCDMESTSSAPYYSRLPTTDSIKAVIIYIKFPDDTTENSDPRTYNWPASLNILPPWAQNTIDSTIRPDYNDPSISGYFKEMSLDTLNLIGKVCPILFVPPHSSSYYDTTSGRNISYLAEDAIRFADTYIDYSKYDVYDPDDYDDDHIYSEPDSTVDMYPSCEVHVSE